MRETVFFNGEFILPQEARVSVLSPGLLYGWGLFETMRSYNNKIVYFDEHLTRLRDSAGLIKIKLNYSPGELKAIIRRAVKLSGFKDAYVRLTLCKSEPGTDTLVVARQYRPYPETKYRQGFRAAISPFRQNEDSPLARIKTTNYLLYRISYLQAQDKNFEESIILNGRGIISEASRSNIFFVQDKQLFTPALECGCLNGITRKIIFDLARKYRIPVNEGRFGPDDLYNSDEAFLTNSLMGVMPLASVENKIIGTGRPGRLSKFFIGKYSHFLL